MGSKTRRSILEAIGVAGTASLAGCMGGTDGNGSTLTWADHWPEEAVIANEGTRYFMDRVEEETDIEFEYLTGGELGGPTEYGELLRQGTIDIGPVAPQYDSDIFPLSEVGVLPGYTEDVDDGTKAYWNTLNPREDSILYQEEWEPNEMRPLFSMVSEPYQLLLQGDPVDTLDELEGLRIRSSGGITEWTLEALGVTPVSMDAEEGYTALERGTLDGNNNNTGGIVVYSFNEVTDYMITNARTNTFVWIDTIRLGAWEGLDSETQDTFVEIAEETMDNYIEEQLVYNEDVRADLEGDIELHELPAAEVEEWNEQLETVSETWLESSDDGELAQEALDAFESEVDGI